MDKILVEQNKHWAHQPYRERLQRECLPELIRLLTVKEIMVLLGVRHCGKTTIFRLLINYLLKNNDPKSILYLNLDDPFFDGAKFDAKYLYKIIENAERLTKTNIQFLFLDEIQNIPTWEKFVKRVYDSGTYKKIFITSSNSSLLHSEYAKLLSGRYISHRIYPLSIREIFTHNGLKDRLAIVQEKSKALSLLDTLINFGFFPEPLMHEDEHLKRKILVSYYETILLKDCIANKNIRDTRLMKTLSHYLITNIAAPFSYHSLTKALGSNEHTLKDYIFALEGGFLLSEVKNFSYSLQQRAKGKKKVFAVDNGMITAVAFKFSSNKGKLFENLIHSELVKIGSDEIYLFNDNKECDFVINVGNQFLPIQACYEINDKNQQRELQGLQLAMNRSKSKQGIIVTYDQTLSAPPGIKILPIWQLFTSAKEVTDLFNFDKF